MEGVWIKVEELEKLRQQAERIKELEAAMPLYDELLIRCALAEAERVVTIGHKTYVQQGGYLMGEAERQEPVAKWDETRGVADRLGLAKIADETLLYTTPQPAIPAGWQLVPVEPTTGMVEVAWDTIKRHGEAVILVYKRMLAAAPKPENSHG